MQIYKHSCVYACSMANYIQTSKEGIDSCSDENAGSQRSGNLLKVMDLVNDKSHDFGHGIEPF